MKGNCVTAEKLPTKNEIETFKASTNKTFNETASWMRVLELTYCLEKNNDNAIQELISDTSKFKKLNEDPTLKREASLQRFLRKLKQKNFFNENEYDKLYPSGSAPARIYGKCTNSHLVIHFLNFVRLFHL